MTSLLSDQALLDLFVDKEPSLLQDSDAFFTTSMEFNSSTWNEFENMLESNDDIFNFLVDSPSQLSPESFIDSIASSPEEGTIVSDIPLDVVRLPSTDSESPLDYNDTVSSGFSDTSQPSPAEDLNIFHIPSPADRTIGEITDDIDIGICADVEVVTTSVIDISDDTEFVEFEQTEVCDVKVDLQHSFPELKLSEEEKKLLCKEGITLPVHLPLTKAEERHLKRIRRKIRNKESAQNSRRRRKEYVDGLESRVKVCTSHNIELKKRIAILEGQNQSLLSQLRKFQAMVANNANKSTQITTCALVMFLSFAFFLLPSFTPGVQKSVAPAPKLPFPGNSRNLLEYSSKPGFGNDNAYGIQHVNENWPQSSPSGSGDEMSSVRAMSDSVLDDKKHGASSPPPPPNLKYTNFNTDKVSDMASNISDTPSPTVVVGTPDGNAFKKYE